MKRLVRWLACVMCGSLLLGCTGMTPQQQRMLSGGAIGAAGGAALGALSGGNPAVGAAIGGAAGVVGGALVK